MVRVVLICAYESVFSQHCGHRHFNDDNFTFNEGWREQ